MEDWDYLIRLVVRAENDARNLSKPIWKSSDEQIRNKSEIENNKGKEWCIWKSTSWMGILPVVPLGLDEGSNPKSDKHSMFLNELNKLHQVIITFKVELHIDKKKKKHFHNTLLSFMTPKQLNQETTNIWPVLVGAREHSKTRRFELHLFLRVLRYQEG